MLIKKTYYTVEVFSENYQKWLVHPYQFDSLEEVQKYAEMELKEDFNNAVRILKVEITETPVQVIEK